MLLEQRASSRSFQQKKAFHLVTLCPRLLAIPSAPVIVGCLPAGLLKLVHGLYVLQTVGYLWIDSGSFQHSGLVLSILARQVFPSGLTYTGTDIVEHCWATFGSFPDIMALQILNNSQSSSSCLSVLDTERRGPHPKP